MMDCKKALVEAGGDYARAQEIIREKGKLVAAKRADRETSEGAAIAKVDGNKAILVALGLPMPSPMRLSHSSLQTPRL